MTTASSAANVTQDTLHHTVQGGEGRGGDIRVKSTAAQIGGATPTSDQHGERSEVLRQGPARHARAQS